MAGAKPSWWITILAILFAIAVAIWAIFSGWGQPPPGDVIILRPEPDVPTDPGSGHFTIGGTPAVATYEAPTSDSLNTNAFTFVHSYIVTAKKNGMGSPQSVPHPDELRATFGHCSDYSQSTPLQPCVADAECSSGQCVNSTLRVTWTKNWLNKKTLEWWLKPSPNDPEIQLKAFNYNNPKKWRGELCGRLIGNIEATYGGVTYIPYPMGGMASIQAKK